MDSTENSNKPNKYFISEDLLDELIREYRTASGELHRSQRDLLKCDPEIIKNDMLAAHGMGQLLNQIMTKRPKEMIHGNSTREYIWQALTGTHASPNRGKGSKGTREATSRSKGPSKSKRKSRWFS